MPEPQALVEQTKAGYMVSRDGVPVPPVSFPPALLLFATRKHAQAFATAVNASDAAEVDRLVREHGRWLDAEGWRTRPGMDGDTAA